MNATFDRVLAEASGDVLLKGPSHYYLGIAIVRTSEPNKNASLPADLEVKDAQLIFNSVWKELEAQYGKSNLHFLKELILL